MLNNPNISYRKKSKKIVLTKEHTKASKFYTLLFNNTYSPTLLNRFDIESSIHNLFYKFNHTPALLNYKAIKTYLKDFKIILKQEQLLLKKRHNVSKILLHKNNLSFIYLKKFIKMYGFRWL